MSKNVHEADENTDERPRDGRATRYEHRRSELLDAVMAYLLDNGLNGMSFRTLAQAVGVSHVTLRHHFGTREELLAEIFTTIRQREPIPAQLKSADVEQLIRNLWQRWSQPEGQRHFRLLFEVYGYALRQPEQHQAFLDGIVSDWITVIAGLAVELGYPRPDAVRLGTRVLAQLRGLQMDLLTTGDHDRVTAAFDDFIAQITRR